MSCPHTAKLRGDLPVLTPRIARLPIDDRGYPVPFFVKYIDGKPDFRVIDQEKFIRCVKEKICWVCGERLHTRFAFTLGPMCCMTRTNSEPPQHIDCSEWSVRGCPFMTKPHMVRREDEMTLANRENSAGLPILRNPGVMAVWTTSTYKIFYDDKKRPLFEVGEPLAISWWREGRPATRVEVMESIRTGMPFLEEACKMESTPEATRQAYEELHAREFQLEVLLPAA